MITFPSNPTIGQLHEVGGRSFRFNGTGWVVAAIPGGVVTQTTGQSIVDVMSQKAVTDALGEQKSDSGITSTQDLPSLNLLAGATQKEVNAAQNTENLSFNTDNLFFLSVSDFGVVTRDYNFKVIQITTSSGVATVTRSNNSAYMIDSAVNANDYLKVTCDTLNAVVNIKVMRI